MSKGTNYTRDKKKTITNGVAGLGSAITDHAMQDNHMDWESARIIDKEREMTKLGGIKEAVYHGLGD